MGQEREARFTDRQHRESVLSAGLILSDQFAVRDGRLHAAVLQLASIGRFRPLGHFASFSRFLGNMAGCPRGVEVTDLLLTAAASVAGRNRTSDDERTRTMAAKKTTPKSTKTKVAPKKAAAKKAAPKPAGRKQTAVKKAAAKKGDKTMSALDAAAKILSESKEPMRAKEMIERMAAKGYWKSPGGQTPAATLHAALTREINTKGQDARFKKTGRGLFAANV